MLDANSDFSLFRFQKYKYSARPDLCRLNVRLNACGTTGFTSLREALARLTKSNCAFPDSELGVLSIRQNPANRFSSTSCD